MTTLRRCYACRKFFPLKDGKCECGTEARPFNGGLKASQWSGNLNRVAAHALDH